MAKPPLPLHNQSEVNSDVTQPDNFNVFVIFISCAYCVVLFLCFYLIPLEFFLIYALSYFIETKKYTVYFYTIYTLFIFFFFYFSLEKPTTLMKCRTWHSIKHRDSFQISFLAFFVFLDNTVGVEKSFHILYFLSC